MDMFICLYLGVLYIDESVSYGFCRVLIEVPIDKNQEERCKRAKDQTVIREKDVIQ